eukprot:9840599-Heterocapsa_arctica.AAC.1
MLARTFMGAPQDGTTTDGDRQPSPIGRAGEMRSRRRTPKERWQPTTRTVSYTHLRAHETRSNL